MPAPSKAPWRQAGDSQLGRPHFAAWMVEQGHVADLNQAFDRYLGQGKTGDVKAFWPELAEVTGWIVAAGGVAVIAHPLKYRFTRMKLRRLVMDFMAAGGAAIEIISGRQTADQTAICSDWPRSMSWRFPWAAISIGTAPTAPISV